MGRSAKYLTDSSKKKARAEWAKVHRTRTVTIGDAVDKWNEAKQLAVAASDSALAMLLLDR